MTLPELPRQPAQGAPKPVWAAWLSDIGRLTGAFKVFPCRPDGAVDHEGKATCKLPRFKGWQADASHDRKTVETSWLNWPDSNIGLLIQPGFVALDADTYKPGKADLLERLQAEYGDLLPTLEFLSANGGEHLIYSTDKLLGNGTGELPHGFDVRGGGKGYVVGPGSTAQGKPYSVSGVRYPLPLAPKLEAAITTGKVREVGARTLKAMVLEDDPKNIDLYRRWLLGEDGIGEMKGAKPSVEGEGGNKNLASAGAMGSSFGLTIDVVIPLLSEFFNPRCEPEWTEEDIERHGGSGYKSASSNYGNKAQPNGKLMFEAINPAGDTLSGLRVYDLDADILHQPKPVRQWAWGTDDDGWMPLRKLTTLYGPGGTGKSTLMLQMIDAFRHGKPLFGGPTKRMPVLLVSCEEDLAELAIRFHAQNTKAGGEPVKVAPVDKEHETLNRAVRPYDKAPEEETKMWLFLDYQLEKLGPGDKLLVLDNLGELYAGNYMDTTEVRRFLKHSIGRLLDKHSATCLLLCHPSDTQKTNGDGSFGSNAWSSGVRSRLYFDWPRKTGKDRGRISDITLRVLSRKKANCTKMHGDGEGLVMTFRNWTLTLVDKPAAQRTAPRGEPAAAPIGNVDIIRQCLQDYLEANEAHAYTPRELAPALSYYMGRRDHKTSMEAVREALNRFIAEGHEYYDPTQARTKWVCKRAPIRNATMH